MAEEERGKAMGRTFVASFATEEEVLAATRAARQQGFRIVDVFTPYAVHGLDQAMGLRPSRLPWACFACGLFGVIFALGFQFWTMTRDWPMNVGGKPWNSLPAYVPITFEVMVLLSGLGVVLAFLLHCRLIPGRHAAIPLPRVTDDRFVLVLDGAEATLEAEAPRQLLEELHAVHVEEREE
jgi:hypothetical protein